MATVGAFDAKTQFSSLLERVTKGETIEITKRGVPVARLIPIVNEPKPDRQQAVRDILEFRKGNKLRGLKIRDLINEGRRY
jgi:prevent-host-death family protein